MKLLSYIRAPEPRDRPRSTRRRRRLLCAGMAVAAAVAGAVSALGLPLLGPEVIRDVVYAKGYVRANDGHGFELRDLTLDIYGPGSPGEKRPAAILVHGGSFEKGSKRKPEIVELARFLAQNGYVCFAINYRLESDDPPAPLLWKWTSISSTAHAAMVDVKAAVRFVRAEAHAYGVDPDRIGLIGESAGAIAAITAAYSDEDDYREDGRRYPQPEDNHPDASSRVQAYVHLWGGADHMLLSVDPGDPPILIVHGAEDDRRFASYGSSRRLRAMLKLRGIPHEFHAAKGEGHGVWDYRHRFRNLNRLILDFLNEHLAPDQP